MYQSGSKGYQRSQESSSSLERKSFCHFLIPFHSLIEKRLPIKAFIEVTLVSLTLRLRTVFENILKKRSEFRRTSFLRSCNLVDLDGNNLTGFIQNFVYNLVNLVLTSKSNWKWAKIG